MGRASEISKDELKFTKFIAKIKKRFTELFNDILKTQLILKNIIAQEDWYTVSQSIQYDYLQDGHLQN